MKIYLIYVIKIWYCRVRIQTSVKMCLDPEITTTTTTITITTTVRFYQEPIPADGDSHTILVPNHLAPHPLLMTRQEKCFRLQDLHCQFQEVSFVPTEFHVVAWICVKRFVLITLPVQFYSENWKNLKVLSSCYKIIVSYTIMKEAKVPRLLIAIHCIILYPKLTLNSPHITSGMEFGD